MATMNISLPDSLREYVEERVGEGGYSTASEFFRELVRQDQRRSVQERFEKIIQESIESGSAAPLTDEHWRALEDELEAKIRARENAAA
jgi:antitoxin ParD1/3/4